jgi:uncharacterized delta-60 repeat protein
MKSQSNQMTSFKLPEPIKLAQKIGLIALLNVSLIHVAYGAAGDLDFTFAGTGTARLGFGGGQDFGQAVAVQADGKVVVAGYTGLSSFFGTKVALVRYITNNVLDPSFGDGGKVFTAVSPNTNASPGIAAVKIQQDGKIVIVGTLYDDTNSYAMLVRYNAEGSLDGTFGAAGIVTNIFGSFARANAMAIQSDGKIVIAGESDLDFLVARYRTNGTLDSSFGAGGIVITDANGDAAAYGVALQADGKIVAAGTGGFDLAVIRYTATGALDSSFGLAHTGKVFTHLGDSGTLSSANAVAIEPGDNVQTLDRIVIAGSTEAIGPWNKYVVARYKLDGTLDAALNGTGVVIDSFNANNNLGSCLLIQGTGTEPRKIIVAGSFDTGGFFDDDIGVIRFNDNGALDSTFGFGGRLVISYGTNLDEANGMAFVGTNKFLVVGSTTINDGNSDFSIARYNLSDGSPDSTFDDDGKLSQEVTDRTSQANATAIQADGKIVLAGSADNGRNNSFVLSRFNADGTLDMSFARFGKAIVDFGGTNASANAVAIQPDGKIIAAGACGDDFAVVRFGTNGTLDANFNGNGIVRTPLAAGRNSAVGIALQPDGKIVLGGSTYNGTDDDFAVLRYTTNGVLDTSFAGTGKVIAAIDTGEDQAHAIKIQADGKIVVAGAAVISGTEVDIAAIRFNTNGTVDGSFGLFGRTAVSVGSGGTIGFSLAIQPDGKLVIAGLTINGMNGDMAVVRLGTNGMPDTTFNGTGKVTTSIGLGVDYATCLALQPDGKIMVGGFTAIGAHYEFASVRYRTDGSLDGSYGIGGKSVAGFDDNADNFEYAMALDSNGRPVLAGSAGGFFGLARLQSDPSLKILSINKLSNGHVVLTGIGVPSASHSVQGATSLSSVSFGTIVTVTADGAGHWQYEDAGAVNQPSRWYRLALP